MTNEDKIWVLFDGSIFNDITLYREESDAKEAYAQVVAYLKNHNKPTKDDHNVYELKTQVSDNVGDVYLSIFKKTYLGEVTFFNVSLCPRRVQ